MTRSQAQCLRYRCVVSLSCFSSIVKVVLSTQLTTCLFLRSEAVKALLIRFLHFYVECSGQTSCRPWLREYLLRFGHCIIQLQFIQVVSPTQSKSLYWSDRIEMDGGFESFRQKNCKNMNSSLGLLKNT